MRAGTRRSGRCWGRREDRDLVRRRLPVVLHRQAPHRERPGRVRATPTRWRCTGAPTSSTRVRRPSRPRATAAMLARKYGQSPEGAQQMQDRVEAVAAEEGLVYRLSRDAAPQHRRRPPRDPPRPRAGRQRAAGPGEGGAARRRTSPRPATSPTTPCCVRSPSAAGLDAARVEEVLGSREFEADVHADIEQAQAYGADGCAVLRHRPEVRRLRRAADRGVHPGARAGVVGVATRRSRCWRPAPTRRSAARTAARSEASASLGT